MPPNLAKEPARPAAGRVEVLQDAPGRIEVSCTGPTWLVVRDWRLPGWRATLDERTPVELTTADVHLMAVYVPGGAHRVTLHYRPPGFGRGLLLAGLGAALAAALVAARPATAERLEPPSPTA